MQLNVLDYLIIAVLLLSALAGLRKGLFNVVGGLAGVLIGLLAAIAFHRELTQYLEKTLGVNTLLVGFLREKLPLPVLDPGLIKVLGYAPQWADPASYLATTLFTALSFLLILLLGSKLVQAICQLLDSLFAHGILSGVNRSLGMGLLLLKNLVILAVLAGILLSPLELAAQMGMSGAFFVTQYMHNSLLLEPLLKLFTHLKSLF
ncbi:CvpA family protein [Syntrophomonas curvata]